MGVFVPRAEERESVLRLRRVATNGGRDARLFRARLGTLATMRPVPQYVLDRHTLGHIVSREPCATWDRPSVHVMVDEWLSETFSDEPRDSLIALHR